MLVGKYLLAAKRTAVGMDRDLYAVLFFLRARYVTEPAGIQVRGGTGKGDALFSFHKIKSFFYADLFCHCVSFSFAANFLEGECSQYIKFDGTFLAHEVFLRGKDFVYITKGKKVFRKKISPDFRDLFFLL